MPDIIYYLFGGIYYLLSPSFRETKKREWGEQSDLNRIHEVGMWVVSFAFLLFVLIYLIFT